MKFSESWLKEITGLSVQTDDLAEQLTMAGLEVESVSACQGVFSGVTVARLVETSEHPGADSLTVCRLDIGNEQTRTVVCGADNIRAGKCYPYAGPGAVLPGGINIKEKSVKGVHSEGMLCSGKELDLSDNGSGIFELGNDAKAGQALEDYLSLNDNIIELSLTPNRGDCLSMVGIAREAAALNNIALSPPEVPPVPSRTDAARNIGISAAEYCPRYCGRIIEDIDTTAATPVWIAERLRRAGLRSISIVVDLTNYVMLELGQPMHAFDNGKLKGDIVIRMAKEGETITLLDEVTYSLNHNTLVIADESGPIAMAGIMGGEDTAVGPETRSLFLESAFFSPRAVMGRARQYGLHTDASHRFERGVDPQLTRIALERLTSLIIGVCGGRAGPVVEAREESHLPVMTPIPLRTDRIKKILGEVVPQDRVREILQRLGFRVVKQANALEVTAPSFRFDVAIEADLVEEIARIQGYQGIKGTLPVISMKMRSGNSRFPGIQAMSERLTVLGYREIITYSFIDPGLASLITPDTPGIKLLNPISEEMSVMRQSLWPGLVSTLLYNLKRQQTRLRLFECGHVFNAADGLTERPLLSGLIYGNIYPEQWAIDNKSCDFYDLKSDIETLLNPGLPVRELRYTARQDNALHEGQSAEISWQNRKIGLMGALNPRIARALGIQRPVYMFELDLRTVSGRRLVKYEKFSKYPWIRRDISIIIDEKIAVSEVLNLIKSHDSGLLHNLELFDVYRGEGIDLGKKSLALGLTFQRSSSTLTDEEADIVVDNILQSLQEQLGTQLRE